LALARGRNDTLELAQERNKRSNQLQYHEKIIGETRELFHNHLSASILSCFIA
jgi:hypothetical protein